MRKWQELITVLHAFWLACKMPDSWGSFLTSSLLLDYHIKQHIHIRRSRCRNGLERSIYAKTRVRVSVQFQLWPVPLVIVGTELVTKKIRALEIRFYRRLLVALYIDYITKCYWTTGWASDHHLTMETGIVRAHLSYTWIFPDHHAGSHKERARKTAEKITSTNGWGSIWAIPYRDWKLEIERNEKLWFGDHLLLPTYSVR